MSNLQITTNKAIVLPEIKTDKKASSIFKPLLSLVRKIFNFFRHLFSFNKTQDKNTPVPPAAQTAQTRTNARPEEKKIEKSQSELPIPAQLEQIKQPEPPVQAAQIEPSVQAEPPVQAAQTAQTRTDARPEEEKIEKSQSELPVNLSSENLTTKDSSEKVSSPEAETSSTETTQPAQTRTEEPLQEENSKEPQSEDLINKDLSKEVSSPEAETSDTSSIETTQSAQTRTEEPLQEEKTEEPQSEDLTNKDLSKETSSSEAETSSTETTQFEPESTLISNEERIRLAIKEALETTIPCITIKPIDYPLFLETLEGRYQQERKVYFNLATASNATASNDKENALNAIKIISKEVDHLIGLNLENKKLNTRARSFKLEILQCRYEQEKEVYFKFDTTPHDKENALNAIKIISKEVDQLIELTQKNKPLNTRAHCFKKVVITFEATTPLQIKHFSRLPPLPSKKT